MGVHDGHRERMKSRFVEAGLEGFNDHNALEMLLFYAVPRKDTNELAHRLLKHFGSLAGGFEASYEETGPYGAKSIGEVVINTPLPAIADAVYNATGKRFCELPITPEQIAMAAK